jgi:hypothetical protein
MILVMKEKEKERKKKKRFGTETHESIGLLTLSTGQNQPANA